MPEGLRICVLINFPKYYIFCRNSVRPPLFQPIYALTTHIFRSNLGSMHSFLCLCEHCNPQKRQISKKTKEIKKRVGATTIPQLAPFGIDLPGIKRY